MVKEKMPSFIATHLDPANRFIMVVCGLIMVLTFTLVGSQLVSDDPSGAQKLLIAALGCNVAWGLIDGVMFVMNGLTERGRRARFVAAVRDATDEAAALSVIGRDLDPELEGITTSEERGTLYRSIRKIALRAAPQAVRIHKKDLLGALAVFCLVFLTTLSAIGPFLFITDPRTALRVSNVILLLMLFVAGWIWAPYINGRRVVGGAAMFFLGAALVALAIALGG